MVPSAKVNFSHLWYFRIYLSQRIHLFFLVGYHIFVTHQNKSPCYYRSMDNIFKCLSGALSHPLTNICAAKKGLWTGCEVFNIEIADWLILSIKMYIAYISGESRGVSFRSISRLLSVIYTRKGKCSKSLDPPLHIILDSNLGGSPSDQFQGFYQ